MNYYIEKGINIGDNIVKFIKNKWKRIIKKSIDEYYSLQLMKRIKRTLEIYMIDIIFEKNIIDQKHIIKVYFNYLGYRKLVTPIYLFQYDEADSIKHLMDNEFERHIEERFNRREKYE